jgi:hypothetical protein
MLPFFILSHHIFNLVPTQRIIGRLVFGPVVDSKLTQALVSLIEKIDTDTPVSSVNAHATIFFVRLVTANADGHLSVSFWVKFFRVNTGAKQACTLVGASFLRA